MAQLAARLGTQAAWNVERCCVPYFQVGGWIPGKISNLAEMLKESNCLCQEQEDSLTNIKKEMKKKKNGTSNLKV